MQIETARLLLRPLTVADLDQFLAMHDAPEVIRTMGPYTRSTAVERLEGYEREWHEHGYGLVSVTERVTGRFVGRSGLKYWPQFDETEVGWVLHPSVWGRGFATEAARACLDWGFRNLDVPYITAMIVPDNTRSLHVAERLGMTPLRSDTLRDLEVIVHSIARHIASSINSPGDRARRPRGRS